MHACVQESTEFENVTCRGLITAKENFREPEIVKVFLVITVYFTKPADLHELELVGPLGASPASAL